MFPFIKLADSSFTIDPSAKIIKAKHHDTYLQSKALIADALKERDKIIEEAHSIYISEKERGYREGLEQWRSQKLEKDISLNLSTQQYYQSVESEMIDLVIDATQKIIGTFDNTDLISRLVCQALEQLSQEKIMSVRVAPEQVAAFRESVETVLEKYPGINTLDIVADNRLTGTECLLEHPTGTFDVGAALQLETLEAVLNQCMIRDPLENTPAR